jgi:hypothetical protein
MLRKWWKIVDANDKKGWLSGATWREALRRLSWSSRRWGSARGRAWTCGSPPSCSAAARTRPGPEAPSARTCGSQGFNCWAPEGIVFKGASQRPILNFAPKGKLWPQGRSCSVRNGGSFKRAFIFTNKEVTNTWIVGAMLTLLHKNIIFIYKKNDVKLMSWHTQNVSILHQNWVRLP